MGHDGDHVPRRNRTRSVAMDGESIRVTRTVELPLTEVELRTSRSSGPGGQHAQKSETRVEGAAARGEAAALRAEAAGASSAMSVQAGFVVESYFTDADRAYIRAN